MYDWEIQKQIEEKKGTLSSFEYLHIVNTSPQIDHINYNSSNDIFKMWSKEGNEFTFNVVYVE